jgi:protein involved in polysaccharide export with SLBB domain
LRYNLSGKDYTFLGFVCFLFKNMNNFKIYLSVLIVIFCFLFSVPAFSQSLPQDLSNFNVDSYSDAQLSAVLKNAKAQGVDDAQLLQMAQAKGLSGTQSQVLQRRIANLRVRENGTAVADTGNLSSSSSRKPNYQNNYADTSALFNNPPSKLFGASLFRNSKANSFQPNLRLATPVNYILGPDDKVVINVTGASLANWDLAVSPEGNINIPGVGIIKVAGSTIEQATTAIKTRLSANNYAVGRGTNVQVTLGDIRTISVRLQGELVKPGTYSISSLSTAFDALYAAGGPSDIGTFRKIEIRRGNKVIRRLDLYQYLVYGNHQDDIALRDQDIIFVPPYGIHVDLKGEVKVPAIFETLPNEKLQNVIDYAGGFTDKAFTARIKVIQASNIQQRLGDVTEAEYATYVPKRGDVFTVEKILDRFENRITVKGAVFRPGDFELKDGLTLSQLIKNAGGLREDAFTGRANITRLNADNTTQAVSFNLSDALNKAGNDIIMQREDVLTVSSIFDLRDKYTVTVKGEIRNPGEFSFSDSINVADLIVKAGGFTEGASPRRIEVSRRIFDSDPNVKDTKIAQIYSINVNPDLKFEGSNFTLRPFDIVSVYSLPGYERQKTVKIEGEVVFPGNYTIEKKNEKISDVIKRAGGLTLAADVEGGSLKRQDISALSAEKSKVDTVSLNKERSDRLRKVQQAYKDSTNNITVQRNSYVGIDLKKILAKPGMPQDLILEDQDVIRIPKKQETVSVNGEVLYSSAVIYSNGKGFKGYILNAGGYTPRALKRGGYVVYPNGTVKGTSKFLFFNIHPKVKPGSEIYIPTKPEKKGNTGQEILGYTTGLASLGAIILGILSLRK